MQNTNFKILPFAEVSSLSTEVMEQLGFHFTAVHLDRTKEGWLRLYCAWKSDDKKMKSRDKYPVKSCTTFCYNETSVLFRFPEIPTPYKDEETGEVHEYKAEIELGIQFVNENGEWVNKSIPYTPKFHENIKYGVLLWFAPDGWNDGENDEQLFKWEEKGEQNK